MCVKCERREKSKQTRRQEQSIGESSPDQQSGSSGRNQDRLATYKGTSGRD